MSRTASQVKVEQDAQLPVERSVLAQAIVDISHAMSVMSRTGLNRKAIVILTAHKSGCSQEKVRTVLDALDELEREYVRR